MNFVGHSRGTPPTTAAEVPAAGYFDKVYFLNREYRDIENKSSGFSTAERILVEDAEAKVKRTLAAVMRG
jgi:hypothetical protein